jgi:hypothetical protein
MINTVDASDLVLKSRHQDSHRKHITVHAQNDIDNYADKVDWAVDYALDILSERAKRTMHLVSILPSFGANGGLYVTVIAEPMATIEDYRFALSKGSSA